MDDESIKMKWKKIMSIIEATKDSDAERVLIVSLEDWNPSILSEKRKQLLLMLKSQNIESETDLAEKIGRKRPNVVADLKLLEHYGLIKRVREGRRIVPKIVKSQIVIY